MLSYYRFVERFLKTERSRSSSDSVAQKSLRKRRLEIQPCDRLHTGTRVHACEGRVRDKRNPRSNGARVTAKARSFTRQIESQRQSICISTRPCVGCAATKGNSFSRVNARTRDWKTQVVLRSSPGENHLLDTVRVTRKDTHCNARSPETLCYVYYKRSYAL